MSNIKYDGVLSVGTSAKYKSYQWSDLDGNTIHQPDVSAADHSFVLDVLKRTTGLMLTMIEATVSDKEQRKAQKDLVKGMFSEEMERVTDMMYSRKKIDEWCKIANEQVEGLSEDEMPEPVDVEDIIFDKLG